MIIHDLNINYSLTTNDRYKSAEKHLEKMKDGDVVIFTGDTLYLMDLSLATIERFLLMLGRFQKLRIFIQDSEPIEDPIEDDSWYQIIQWPNHVTLFKNLEHLMIDGKSYKVQKHRKIAYKFEVDKRPNVDLDETQIDNTLINHQHDVVGLFIEDIRTKGYSKEKELEVIRTGLDHLVRR
jgi:hypothetical protein